MILVVTVYQIQDNFQYTQDLLSYLFPVPFHPIINSPPDMQSQ